MPSFLEYIKEKGELPKCLTMSLSAYIAFYSNDIQALTDAGLVCKRPAGNEYTVSDDRWALEFYYAHKDDSAADLVKAVLANKQMWDQDRCCNRRPRADPHPGCESCLRKLSVIV
jgi:tagaturonate reductase